MTRKRIEKPEAEVRGLSVPMAAIYLGVGQNVVRQMIARGELPYFVVGLPAGARKQGVWRIDRRDLDALIEAKKVQVQP